MELYEANRILRTVKTAVVADGFKIPSSAETDGLLMLLGRLDGEKFLAPKIKHARTLDPKSAAFDRAYALIAFFRALSALSSGIADPVTAMSVLLLHKSLCGDLDPEAGKPRTVEVLTCGNAHTDPKYIPGSLKSIVSKMNEIPGAPQTAKDDFAGYLSHYMRELLILHPFERGSELTVRIFTVLFCKLKGFALALHRVTPSALKNAESTAFAADDVAPLFRMFSECLTYDCKTVQPRPRPPRTRREIANDIRPHACIDRAAPSEAGVRHATATERNAQDQKQNDEVLKRAIRIQQKISKLNEQLAELMATDDE